MGAQGELMNRLREGTGTAWRVPGEPATGGGAGAIFAPNDWMRQVGNETYGRIGQQFTGGAQGIGPWMQGTSQAILANPATDLGQLSRLTPSAFSGASSGVYAHTPEAVSNAGQMAQYTGQAVNAGPMSQYQAQATGYGGPGAAGQYTVTPRGVAAYDPTAALSQAQNYMNRVVAPQIAQNMVAGGSGGASGAMLEALANAGAGMALPITQQVMGNQAAWFNPQLQGAVQGGLGQQAAQNQMLYGTQQSGQQGELARQGAQNQMLFGTQGAQQGALGAQQQAQNAFLGAQQQGGIQSTLDWQRAQNQMLAAQQQAGLQGLLNQGQNQFAAQMAIPGMQGQFLQNAMNAGNAQMGIAGMDQQAAMNAYLNQQQQYNNMLANLGALGTGTPAMNSTTTRGGGGGAGFLGNAATGAMIGAPFGPWGAAIGGLGGGLLGLF